jgi:hypothetical protein
MQCLDFDERREHAIEFDSYAVITTEQHAATRAAFTEHHDPRPNADGRTMIPDNLEQDRADGDALADVDVDQRTGGIRNGGGEYHTLLIERLDGEGWRLRTVIHASPHHCVRQVAISAPFRSRPTVVERRTGRVLNHRQDRPRRNSVSAAARV